MSGARLVGAVALGWCAFVGFAACGARTGLIPDDEWTEAGRDARVDRRDVAIDIPKLDIQPKDAPPIGCPDASQTLIYVVTWEHVLYSFYPPTLTFTPIGTLACPSSDNANSMAVDRKGTAYVNYWDGNVFKVSTATASCQTSGYTPYQGAMTTFGMSFVGVAAVDTLYVAEHVPQDARLAAIDTTTTKMSVIGKITPDIGDCELTGTGDGRLYAFCPNEKVAILAELDRSNAKVLAANDLPLTVPKSGYAFAFALWGGDFWLFTAPSSNNPTSTVTRYSPGDGSTKNVSTFTGGAIVGAGVSTCAPL